MIKNSIIAIFGLVIVGGLLWYGYARQGGTVAEPVATTSAPFTFVHAASGESIQVAFGDNAAVLTGVGYTDLRLPQAISGSGARYFNEEEKVELWNNGNEVTLSKAGEQIFTGVTLQNADHSDTAPLTGTSWVWVRTELNSDEVITPRELERFTLTFGDGAVSGTTDCNSFHGAYTAGDGSVTFGMFAITKMYCADSQESDFVRMVSDSDQYLFTPAGDLVLIIKFDSGAVIFKKK